MLQTRTALTLRPCPLVLLRHADRPHPERDVARGTLVKVRAGVYAPAAEWTVLPPWDRYLCRVYAVAMIRPDAVFLLESAAALRGLPVFGDPVTVHVLDTGGSSRGAAGVRVHRGGPDRALADVDGIAMTTLRDTAVDIARRRHNAIGLAVADAATRLDPGLTTDILCGVNETRISSRGRNLARWPLRRASARAETALESVSRAAIEWLGFADPEQQVGFRHADGVQDRVDFLWRGPDQRPAVAGESDGDLKYDGRFGDPAVAVRAQRERDRRLQRHVRSIAHWGWSDVVQPTSLRAILAGAGLQAVRPEVGAQLITLRRALNPRP